MNDDAIACCLNDYTHGPAVGEQTTGTRFMPEYAEAMGDGGLVEVVDLLCAECLYATHDHPQE